MREGIKHRANMRAWAHPICSEFHICAVLNSIAELHLEPARPRVDAIPQGPSPDRRKGSRKINHVKTDNIQFLLDIGLDIPYESLEFRCNRVGYDFYRPVRQI